jgi:hypothetical protein
MVRLFLAWSFCAALVPVAAEAASVTLCAYTPGAAASVVSALVDELVEEAALRHGLSIEVRAYTKEGVAVDAYLRRDCDLLLATGARMRQLEVPWATLEAVGGAPDYEVLRLAIERLTSEEQRPLMVGGGHESLGALPIGAAFLVVADRTWTTVEHMRGRSIAIIGDDPAAKRLAAEVGARPVASDVDRFAGVFKEGTVDIIYANALAIQAMDLGKAIESRGGGVLKAPLAQVTFQMAGHSGALNSEVATWCRGWFLARFDTLLQRARQSDALLAPLWISSADEQDLGLRLRDTRMAVRGQPAGYDGRVLALLHQVRCKDQETLECLAGGL